MIRVLRTNGLSQFTDKGRSGYRRFGVPAGGAMDIISALRANSMLGNLPGTPVVEWYMAGHHFICERDCHIALAGAPMILMLNGEETDGDQKISFTRGDQLEIHELPRGQYSYLAIEGGFVAPELMGSCHTLLPYLDNRIRKDSLLKPGPKGRRTVDHLSRTSGIRIRETDPIQVYPGPEWIELGKSEQLMILDQEFAVSRDSNRMAYRMEAVHKCKTAFPGIISSGVMAGTVQLLPSGLPLILMRDAQTTGGYLRILQLSEESICRLAHFRPGQKLRFSLIGAS